jgi:hypothetical protein
VLKLASDGAIGGDGEPAPMAERPHVKAAQQDLDARRILAASAHTAREVGARIADPASLRRRITSFPG